MTAEQLLVATGAAVADVEELPPRIRELLDSASDVNGERFRIPVTVFELGLEGRVPGTGA